MIYYRCYPKGCAAPGEVQCQCNTQGTLSKLKRTPSQAKINVTSKSPVGDISVVTLIRTDTTLDHSQKAEKVCSSDKKRGITLASARCHSGHANWADSFIFLWTVCRLFPYLPNPFLHEFIVSGHFLIVLRRGQNIQESSCGMGRSTSK